MTHRSVSSGDLVLVFVDVWWLIWGSLALFSTQVAEVATPSHKILEKLNHVDSSPAWVACGISWGDPSSFAHSWFHHHSDCHIFNDHSHIDDIHHHFPNYRNCRALAAWAAWAAWLTPAPTPQLSSRWKTPQKLRPQRPQRLQRPQWPQRLRTLRRAGHHWVGCGQPLRPPTAGGPSSWCRSSFRAKTRWLTTVFSTNVDKNSMCWQNETQCKGFTHTQHFHDFGPHLHRLLHRSCNSWNRTEDEWWATRKVKGIHCSRKPHL